MERAGETGIAQDSVRLDHDQRSRRRMVFRTQGGASILLDMARPGTLRDGDALRLEDGSRVAVEATAEALLEIQAVSTAELVRIAWHLGNRHLPTQLVPGADGVSLRIRDDHVIAAMVVGLGGTCEAILEPFDPEGGAYAGGGANRGGHAHADAHSHHHHGDGHDHSHPHGHDEHHHHGHAHG
ncbi:MAG: urease accessory protein UreE [Sphingobium sp.]